MRATRPSGLIYLDHNAGTPLLPEVAAWLGDAWRSFPGGNPSSVHRAGRAARARLEGARSRVAAVLGARPRDIVFTASGTEADALAIKGFWGARPHPERTRIVASPIEHPAVVFALEQLGRAGATVDWVPPGADGRVSSEQMCARLSDDVALCTLMAGNNETGVLQPVAEVGRACRAAGVCFHVDAVQTAGKGESSAAFDADLTALSAHKFGGPPGVGVLVVRRGVPLSALAAGHQEGGRRGGTPPVPLVEAAAMALELSTSRAEAERPRLAALRDALEQRVCTRLPGTRVHGAGAPRLPGTSSLRFPGVDGEALLIALDLEGLLVSSGAACASGTLKPSHVLCAMGLSEAEARSSIRVSLGAGNVPADVDRLVEALERHVPRCRATTAAA